MTTLPNSKIFPPAVNRVLVFRSDEAFHCDTSGGKLRIDQASSPKTAQQQCDDWVSYTRNLVVSIATSFSTRNHRSGDSIVVDYIVETTILTVLYTPAAEQAHADPTVYARPNPRIADAFGSAGRPRPAAESLIVETERLGSVPVDLGPDHPQSGEPAAAPAGDAANPNRASDEFDDRW